VIGKTLGNYTVLSQLGAGGMGVVYAAEHKLIGRMAAVKRLLPALSSNKSVVDRFFNEARAAALIKHPGVVDIFDFGYTEDGDAYIIMEFLEGESLSDRIARGRSPDAEVIRIARQVASTLAAVHETEIIHRDLKPENIFLVADSEVAGGERTKVLDFGIAKLAEHHSPGSARTQTGQVMGSPLYMSPEQCRGAGAVDSRTDIYALGCIMYEMACGRPLFDGEGVGEVIAKQIYETQRSPRTICATVSEKLEAIILRALEKEPAERYASMSELVSALDAASDGQAVTDSGTCIVPGEGEPASTDAPIESTDAPVESSKPALTTLGKAATVLTDPDPDSEALPRTETKRWPFIAATVAAIAIGGGLVAFSGREPIGNLPVAADNRAAAPPPATTSSATSVVAAAPSAPAPAPSAQVTIEIASEPSGADVYRVADGARIGQTPLKTPRDRGEAELALILKLDGYLDEKIAVSLREDHESVVKLKKREDIGAPSAAPKIGKPKVAQPRPPEQPKPPEPKPQPTRTRSWGDPTNPLDG